MPAKTMGWTPFCWVVLLLVACAAGPAYALTGTAVMEDKAVVTKGSVYPVAVGAYAPALTVAPVERPAAQYDTPENAAQALLSAMAMKDYEWWLQSWTAASRFAIEQRDKQLSRGAAYWADRWSLMDGKTVEIRYRADYSRAGEQYALIGYGVVGLKLGNNPYESTLAFKKENGSWLATQELSADPVFNNALRLWHASETTLNLP